MFIDETKFEAQKVIDAGFLAEASVQEAIGRTAKWYLEKGKNESAQWHQPPALVLPKTFEQLPEWRFLKQYHMTYGLKLDLESEVAAAVEDLKAFND